MPSTADISPLSITDGKISNEARIAHAKLAKATEGQILVAQSNGKFAAKSLAGDVTLDASGNTTSNVAVSTDGTTVVTGATGAKGDTGSTGSQGATGATGAAGTDATVTATTVNAAGAIMHTDVPDSDTGFVKRTGAETYDVDTATYSTTGHTHDDRYYTETEADTLLATKSGTGHTHDDRYYTETESDTLLATKSGTGHNHDDRYYTETEADTLLATKSGTSHTHDDRYYTETEADTLLATKSATTHTHDGRYYTETETDTLLATKAGTGHTHDDRYYTETEADTLLATKAASSHTHDDRYYTETEADTLLATKAATSHTHDDRYYTETEADTLLATKAASSHTHDDLYYQESEFLNASAGAGDAGKPVKLDAGGHIDSTMINDGDISFVDLDDLPSTFAPSSHNHAATDITSGTLDTARLDVGASSGKVAAGDHTHSQYSTFDIDDSSALTTDVWSASKIISYLATFYATLSNGFSSHKYTATVTGDASGTTIFYVTHNLGTYHVVVSVRHPIITGSSATTIDEMFDEQQYTLMDVGHSVAPGVEVATINSSGNACNDCVAIRFPSAPANGDDYLVTIIG